MKKLPMQRRTLLAKVVRKDLPHCRQGQNHRPNALQSRLGANLNRGNTPVLIKTTATTVLIAPPGTLVHQEQRVLCAHGVISTNKRNNTLANNAAQMCAATI
tara:strand:- start:11 stop:316 length:306 start_codon:yes stop_codon:yes gene_type:complete